MSASEAARAVADAQLVAYNARDMEAYLALFHTDALLVNLPDQSVIAEGIAAIRAMYEARFAMPGLRCVVYEKSEIGTVAIDRETVYTDANPPVDIVAMYDVTNGKIARIFFIRAGAL
jgi:uncharacterized protein (TIGR02246 family)